MSSPTSRNTSRKLLAAAAALAAAATLFSGCSSSAPGGGRHSSVAPPSSDDSYGALPSFLPAAEPGDRTLTGSTDRPALTVEGDSVRALLADGAAVTITVSGPVVPGSGLPHASPAPTCTWTVTLADATRPVPVSATAFTARDHLGAVFSMALVPGAERPPAVLGPGARTTFELRAVMPAGEGVMRWAPVGGRTVGSWDFVVEND